MVRLGRWLQRFARVFLPKPDGFIEDANRFLRLSQTTDNIVVITDHQIRITWVNNAFEKVTGYSAEEAIGKRPNEFLQGPLTDESTIEYMRSHIQRAEKFSCQLLNYRKSGEPYWIELTAIPEVDENGQLIEYFSIQRDITPQKRYESSLSMWKQAFDVSSWGMLFCTDVHDPVVFEQNASAEKLLAGLQEGAKLSSMFAEQSGLAFRKALNRLTPSRPQSFNAHLKTKESKEFSAIVNFSLFMAEQGDTILLVNIQDLTHVQSLEEQLQESHKLEAIGRMSADMVHDLNNALANILVNTELGQLMLTKDSPLESQQMDPVFDAIFDSTKKASLLIHEFLLFTRKESVNFEVVNLASVVSDVLNLFPKKTLINVSVVSDIPDETFLVWGSNNQLEHLLLNLVNNALHAIEKADVESGEINIRLRSIEAIEGTWLDSRKHWIELSVNDNGPGIPEAIQDKIFTPLFTTKPKGTGSGLGLSIVKTTVERHNGYVRLASKPGHTKFSVILESISDHIVKPTYNETPDTSANPITDDVKAKRVAILDDHASITSIWAQVLDANGFKDVTEFNDPLEFRDQLFVKGRTVDLLITDLSMPGMTGLELIREIRARDQKMVVIVCSGFISDSDIAELEGLDVDNVLNKPLSFNDLLAAIGGVSSKLG